MSDAEYGEYATVDKVRGSDLAATSTADDTVLLDYIRQASNEIDSIACRRFYPRIETRYYDTPRHPYDLHLNEDTLSITSLTNGDGTNIASDEYNLYPLNQPTKQMIRLLPSCAQWQNADNGYPDAALTIVGEFGYKRNHRAGWKALTSLNSNITTSQTTMAVPTGQVKSGMLLEVDSEILYASGVTISTADTVTVERAVNGSTATSHTTAASVATWKAGPDIETLTRNAALAYYRLRANPTGNSVIVDGVEYTTPKDVAKYIDTKLSQLGYKRLGIG